MNTATERDVMKNWECSSRVEAQSAAREHDSSSAFTDVVKAVVTATLTTLLMTSNAFIDNFRGKGDNCIITAEL